MPYKIVKGKGARPWKIKKGNKIVGTSTSRAKAARSIGYREAAEAGKPIKKKKQSSK